MPASLLPAAVARTADLTAHATLAPGRLELAGIDGRVDAERLAGSLGFRTGGRPAVQAVLQIDRLDLDPWLPGAWPGLAALPARFGPLDVGLDVTAHEVAAGGLRLGPLKLDVAVDAGAIRLRRLEVAEGAASAVASGTLGAGDASATAGSTSGRPPPRRCSRRCRLPFTLPGDPARFGAGPAEIALTVSGPPESLSVRLAGAIGDLRVEADPVVNLPDRLVSGVLTLRHPGAPRLAEALGLKGAASWLGEGSLGLVAEGAIALPGRRPGGSACVRST